MKFLKTIYSPYIILFFIYLFFILFALIFDSPSEILYGLKSIILSSDILITDYIEVGGIGATLINSALTSLLSLLLLILMKVKPNGSTIMALWLMTGFSFLGKNIFNIWPIIIGVYLFSKYQKEPFLNYTLVAILGTSLSPVVSQITFSNILPLPISIIIGIFIGILVGFILHPIASYTVKIHNGYNLYNIGFASGLLGSFLMSIIRSFGIELNPRLIWHTGSNTILFIFIMICCLYLITIGLIYGNNNKHNLSKLNTQSGRLVSDFYFQFGSTTYINMGILGILATLFVLLIGSDLNGATICGIFTIVGFGAFGKNIKNTIPIIIGSSLATLFNINGITYPPLVLSILFSTTLAPISGRFGWKIGIVAGILHVNIVSNIGYLHGGLNLYNNGLAGGFVAMILIPLISTFKKEL